MFFIWCWLFHKKYRKRTGERHIGRISISYYLKCEKCGNESRETFWDMHGGYWT